ncbi:MAG: hypothetical protein NC302_09305 [Bacteroidales bacterium]|nr:hypothetical protein [Bacteroidales bacterium]MCM1416233.1 hypothetical protein [bacterium]MCM1424965.1 hypothetical protein [bacterium]
MKLVKRISLFMAMSAVMLGLGGYGALKAEDYFYPNRDQRLTEVPLPGGYSISVEKTEEPDKKAEKEPEDSVQEQVIEAAVTEEPVVTADTLYLVEHVNLTKGTAVQTQETMPVKYIGLDREALLAELDFYCDNPPLAELEQGFETAELTAFSKERVAVCKYYRDKTPKHFYLKVADHFIIVCEEDGQTLYMNTDILLERLPDSLQREIMGGKPVASEEELYLFLESYSS